MTKCILEINGEYRIELDKYSWAISKYSPKTERNKTDKWQQIRWYPTLEQACQGLIHPTLMATPTEDINKLIEAVQRLSTDVQKAIKDSGLPNSTPSEEKST